eukprot:gb/GFBE01060661.1/.p1 GENE.gb/GFBE01060661.1/~~gb/GFBE01060661.1/.p1  ORF type:complete len:553 (+),score=103.79 gb/GFBE01060661.1/:1-1659(+)
MSRAPLSAALLKGAAKQPPPLTLTSAKTRGKGSRQISEPLLAANNFRGDAGRQSSAPAKLASKHADYADLDPRVQHLFRQISEGTAQISIPLAPVFFSLPPMELYDSGDDDEEEPSKEEEASDLLFPELPELEDIPELDVGVVNGEVRCVLEPEDAAPVLAVGCLMSMAQGASMCAFLGTIGYFSRRFDLPQLILYATIVQSASAPVVLELQRRLDHVFDDRFGHRATFLFRIGGLSLLQVLLLVLAPQVMSVGVFLLLACLSATTFSTVYAKVCQVVSCVDGPQAVNFARTASHCGGLVVAGLAWAWSISTESDLSSVVGFYLCAAALQAFALAAWYREHLRNKSLSAAYAVIAYQQSHSAEVAAQMAAAEGEGEVQGQHQGGYTLSTMFGSKHRAAGVALLCSFGLVQFAFSLIQSLLNMFGDENLTQQLLLTMYYADIIGRVASHFVHGLEACACARQAPPAALHALTAVAVAVCAALLLDTELRFLTTKVVGQIMLVMCALTAFNLNELAVHSIRFARCRSHVAHCQNYVFFGATGLAKFAALLIQGR